MKRTASILLAGALILGAAEARSQSQPSFTLMSPAQVTFPATEVCLTDLGGVGDGVTLNTAAFENAIAALDEKGGGRLVVPAGCGTQAP